MERLEIIKDVVAIFRDILLIVAFVVFIVAGLTIVNFVNSIDPSQLSCQGLVNSLMTGDFSAVIGGSPEPKETYQPTQEMLDLMGEIEASAMSYDKDTALAKIGELRELAGQKGMTEAVSKIDELKDAIEKDRFVQAFGIANTLKKMFGQ